MTIHGDLRQPELQMGGEGGRKETIYEGTFENIMEVHSSVVIIHNQSLPRGHFTYWIKGGEFVKRLYDYSPSLENRRNASSKSILMLVWLIEMSLQTPRVQLEELSHPPPSNTSRSWTELLPGSVLLGHWSPLWGFHPHDLILPSAPLPNTIIWGIMLQHMNLAVTNTFSPTAGLALSFTSSGVWWPAHLWTES